MQETNVAMPELAQKITSAMPALESSERQLAVQLYRLLGEGAPVWPGRLAEAADCPEPRVRQILRQWPGV